jgi:hypothetical protein
LRQPTGLWTQPGPKQVFRHSHTQRLDRHRPAPILGPAASHRIADRKLAAAEVNLAKLAPLIARLQPTDETITSADRRQRMPLRNMLVTILMFGVSAPVAAFSLGLRLANRGLADASTGLITLCFVMWLGVIALYATMALRRARELDRPG